MNLLKRFALLLPLVFALACSAEVSLMTASDGALVALSDDAKAASLVPVPVTDSALLDALQDPRANVDILQYRPNGKWQIRLKTGEVKPADFSVRQAIYKALFASTS